MEHKMRPLIGSIYEMCLKNCGRNFYSCICGWKGCFYHAENGEFHLAVYSHDNAECGTASRRYPKVRR